MTATLASRDRHGGDRAALLELLGATLAYAREREYVGWDYADGMSSRVRRALPFDNRWVNLAFQEAAKRAPVNVRPLLLVERRRNYKGAALFAMANLTAARQVEALDRPPSSLAGVDYRGEARDLLDWLLAERSTGYSGFCGGHNHEIQGLSGRGEVNDADAVSTAYAVRALLDGASLDQRYPDAARTAERFVVEDLDYEEVPSGATVDYYQDHPEDSYTINAAALAARLLVDLHAHFGEEAGRDSVGEEAGRDGAGEAAGRYRAGEAAGRDRVAVDSLRERATKILDHVASLQTDRGGWYYRDPPDASHLSMDSHHNGFVIECLQRYAEVTGSDRYEDTLDRALDFYRDVLFEEDGAPNFDESDRYPRDIHAATQGVLVFTYAGEYAFARRIVDWVLEHLHAGEGRFYYREHRLYVKRITLMRWCQAWMAYALAEHVAERFPAEGTAGVRRAGRVDVP